MIRVDLQLVFLELVLRTRSSARYDRLVLKRCKIHNVFVIKGEVESAACIRLDALWVVDCTLELEHAVEYLSLALAEYRDDSLHQCIQLVYSTLQELQLRLHVLCANVKSNVVLIRNVHRLAAHCLLDRLLQGLKLLGDCLMHAALEHDQLSLAGAE